MYKRQGLTFIENAILKARHAAKVTGLPAIADDSGLAVDALGGAPGIYSARYSGEDATDQKNLQKLLETMKDVPDDQRPVSYTHLSETIRLALTAAETGHLVLATLHTLSLIHIFKTA